MQPSRIAGNPATSNLMTRKTRLFIKLLRCPRKAGRKGEKSDPEKWAL
jgi:hypothetical protein